MSLEAVLGYRFRDPELLELALTHRSSGQTGEVALSNERLEYLGDAVLDLVVAHELFAAHPHWSEGELTWTRAALVNARALATCARGFGLGEHVRLGKSERQGRGAEKDSILANVLEAVVGAIYLDGELEPVRTLVRRWFAEALAEGAAPRERDPKMRFQEWAHRRYRSTPSWRVLQDSGDEKDPTRFTAAAIVKGLILGRGVGRTKRAAERAAALDALSKEEEA